MPEGGFDDEMMNDKVQPITEDDPCCSRDLILFCELLRGFDLHVEEFPVILS